MRTWNIFIQTQCRFKIIHSLVPSRKNLHYNIDYRGFKRYINSYEITSSTLPYLFKSV